MRKWTVSGPVQALSGLGWAASIIGLFLVMLGLVEAVFVRLGALPGQIPPTEAISTRGRPSSEGNVG